MNNFPISVSQIATGMTNASSALAAAGNTFDQSVALLTAANVTIQDASRSSTGLRTIAARIRNTKTELDALGETDNFAKYDKLVQALTRYNVALTDVSGQYRSTYDILQDISKIWDQLDSMEQAALAQQLAGTRQQAVFYSIIEQFKDAEAAVTAMENAGGTLKESYDFYLDSMSAHVNTFKNAWIDLSSTIADKGTVTSIVDTGTAIVNVANKLAKVHMLLPAISASIIAIRATLQFIKKEAAFTNVSKSIATLSPESLKAAASQQILAQATINLSKAQKDALASTIAQKLETSGMAKEDISATLAKMGLVTATEAEVVANKGLLASIRALLASNPIGWAILLASLIVPIIQKIHDATEENKRLKKSFDDYQDDLKKSKEATSQAVDSFRDMKKSVEEILPRFNELADGVDNYGRNVSLTDEEYSEFIELQNRLGDLLPNIVKYVDDNGNKVLDLNDVTKNYNETIKEQISLYRQLEQIEITSHTDEALTEITGQTDILIKRMNVLKAIRDGIERGGVIDTSNIVDSDEVEYYNKILGQLGINMNNVTGATATSLTLDTSSLDVESILGNISAFEEEMGAKIGEAWSNAAEYANAYFKLSPAYEAMSEEMRLFFSNIVAGVDYSEAGIRTSEGLKRYINDGFIKPIESMTPETQAALTKMINIKEAFGKGIVGAKDYISALDEVKAQLSAQGFNDSLTSKILGVLDDDGIRSKFDVIKRGITGTDEAVEDFLNTCSEADIEILFKIVESQDSITLDDIKNKLLDVKAIVEEISVNDALDLSGVFGDIDNVANDISSITNEMQKLQKGTSLTAKEMLALAKKYPQLLKQANLFTDGSIAGQKKLLDTVMECSKKEFNTVLDTKIKELEMVKSNLEAQKKIEQEKLKYMTAIHEQLIKGEISDRGSYLKAVDELSKLELKQYAKYEGGKITVASKSLDVIEQDTVDFVNTVKESAYIPNAENLANTYKAGAGEVVATTGKMFEQIIQMAANNETSIADAVWFSRATSEGWSPTDAWNYLYGNSLSYNLRNAISGRGGYSIEGALQQLDGAIADANRFLDNIDTAILEATNSINNLEALKNMDFSLEVTDSNTSSSSSSSEDKEQQERDRQQQEQQRKIRDVLNQLLKDLKSFYDAQKQMLKDQLEDEKYLREQAEKRKTVNDLENLIAQLGLDDSAWAKKRRIALEKELQDAKDKLDEFEQNRAVSEAEKMYDEEYAKQAAIINELLSDNNATVEEINDKLQGIYNTLKGGSAPALGAPYASGTRRATAGLHMIDEHGSETILQSSNGNRYRMFSGGEKVLNAGASEFLYKFASSYGKSLTHGVSGIPSGISRNGNPSISMGNIIISGNADDRTVSEIRRAQRDQVRDLLTMFGRMK